jgi:hypothetical protein
MNDSEAYGSVIEQILQFSIISFIDPVRTREQRVDRACPT